MTVTSETGSIVTPEVPRLRGVQHLIAAPLAVIGGLVLLLLADSTSARIAVAVFMVASTALFATSATYHMGRWLPRTKAMLRRADHSNIFLIIAGTYTPLSIMALPPEKGYLLLVLVWTGAAIGIGFRVFWIGAPRWAYVPLYVLLGWAAVLYIVDLLNANLAMMVLVIVGGLLYSVGAVVYGLKKPNPWPGHFGFHEIFHACTVLAFMCHWTATLLIALAPAYHA